MDADEIVEAGVAIGMAGLTIGMANKLVKNIEQPVMKCRGKGKGKNKWF